MIKYKVALEEEVDGTRCAYILEPHKSRHVHDSARICLLRINHSTNALSDPLSAGLTLLRIKRVKRKIEAHPPANAEISVRTSQSLAVKVPPDNGMPIGKYGCAIAPF